MNTIKWVKKCYSSSDYKKWIQDNAAYCVLNQDSQGVWVGFSIAGNELPMGCYELSNEEMFCVNNYRKHANISPSPL